MSDDDRARGDFLVVGIGASAGGLEAISELLRSLPAPTRLAAIIVQHLDPHHESMLVELLARITPLPVRWATAGQALEPGNLYVVPSRACVALKNGVLAFHEHGAGSSIGEIDHCFQSLAADAGHRAVGVILSGNGNDGTAGARAIKEAGGIVFAQDPEVARFPAMPRAAIDANCVDRVLPGAEIGVELGKLTQQAPALWHRLKGGEDDASEGGAAAYLATILRLVGIRSGVDFTEYKRTTIKRRLARQMMLAKVPDLPGFVALLKQSRDEVDRLYESLLINVTGFFRDPDYFDCLRQQVLPTLLAAKSEDQPLRFWVPGCSTGEEAYSLGILVRELFEEKGRIRPVQIFGTDVSEPALAHARAAQYSAADVAGIAPDRLRRFFFKSERGYVIQKSIRDLCIFARQNVVKDSPVSRIDLLSCRNLLIYLNARLQKKLMPVFHYALNPGGYLVLGNSESVGGHADLFRLVDRRFRIYVAKATSRRRPIDFPLEHTNLAPAAAPGTASLTRDMNEPFDILHEADRLVIQRHAPHGVVVNDDLEILQFRGDVSPYLALSAGRASLHLLKLAREGLSGVLQSVLTEARETNARVQRAGVSLPLGGAAREVEIDVTPIDAPRTRERFYLVLFTPQPSEPAATPPRPRKRGAAKPAPGSDVEQLRQELQIARNFLQRTIEKHETTNQELRAANEEIQSSNEELQSTNEELETAKEELQSTNEELTTVNDELHSRQLELIQLNNDLSNLINSIHLPIIILDRDLRIRRFTPMAQKVLNVIPTDIGRPLSDINVGLELGGLRQIITEVIDTLESREVEMQDQQGRWHALRVRPYRTADNKIDGAIVALIDIHDMRNALAEADEARQLARAIFETTREPLAVLTAELRIERASPRFYDVFQTSPERAEGKSLFEAVSEPEKLEPLKKALLGIIPTLTGLTNDQVRVDLPGTGARQLTLDVRQIRSSARTYPLLLLSVRVD